MTSFGFPSTLDGESVSNGDNQPYYEGPVPRIAPAFPPSLGQRPSVYRLHRVNDHEQMVELTVFDIANFAYDPPPGHVPAGLVQWYVKHPGDPAFALYGSPFFYKQSRASEVG